VIHIYIYIYIYICMYVCMYVCIYIYIYITRRRYVTQICNKTSPARIPLPPRMSPSLHVFRGAGSKHTNMNSTKHVPRADSVPQDIQLTHRGQFSTERRPNHTGPAHTNLNRTKRVGFPTGQFGRNASSISHASFESSGVVKAVHTSGIRRLRVPSHD
jgi:hypothetical protein